jgi:GT2 family glycosyltransferase
LLRRALTKRERKATTVSVLVTAQQGGDALRGLLESLARQTMADQLDLIVMRGDRLADDSQASETILQSLFPDRHEVVTLDGAGRAAQLNQAAARAKGRYLLVADETMLLSDPRTVETLCLMASDPGVASASCVVVRETSFKKGRVVRFHSGGLYPSHLSFQSTPQLIFNEPHSLAAFPCATYPVSGNVMRLAMIPTAAWRALDGLDAGNFPVTHYDLDFALRGLKAGYRHLCTSAVTAADFSAEAGQEHVDVFAASYLSPRNWHEVLSSVAILRDLSK